MHDVHMDIEDGQATHFIFISFGFFLSVEAVANTLPNRNICWKDEEIMFEEENEKERKKYSKR